MTLVIRTTGIEDYLDGGSGRIKALIMGAPGSGKTRSASFWPKPLLADCEEGRMSVADRRIPYAAIKSTQDMKALLTMAESEAHQPKDKRRFETLVIDTLDAYQRLVIQDYLRVTKKAAMSGWQDWGHLDAEMNNLIARLQNLPMHVVINLHVKDTKVGENDEGEGGYLVKSPKLKGDLRDQIAADFDLVGYMETGWEAINGKRALARYIQWEPTPDKPILKDRSGQLPAKTPVTFTEADFTGLRDALKPEGLPDSEVVQELATPAPVEPEPVEKGGPVGTGGAKTAPAKKAAAKKAAPAPAPAVAPPAPAIPPVTTTSVPAVAAPIQPAPAPAEPVTEPEAMAAVEQVLGGQVIEEEATNPDTPDEAPSQVPSAPADASTSEGDATVACGSPRYAGATPVPGAEGCGTAMTLTLQDDRVTGCTSPEGQSADLIQIAGMKTRAYLCNPCFAAYRKSLKN